MKTGCYNLRRSRRIHNGSAVIVVLAVMTILVMLLAANTATLNSLRRQVSAIEKRQVQRLATQSAGQTHAARSGANSFSRSSK